MHLAKSGIYYENADLSGSVAIFMFRGELHSFHREPLMAVWMTLNSAVGRLNFFADYRNQGSVRNYLITFWVSCQNALRFSEKFQRPPLRCDICQGLRPLAAWRALLRALKFPRKSASNC
ncbi:MAG: hypothetical protein ACR2PT_21790 [Endozoicomonas sp.]